MIKYVHYLYSLVNFSDTLLLTFKKYITYIVGFVLLDLSCGHYIICTFYMISDSDNPFGIFKLLAIALSVLLRFMDSDPFFGIFILLTILLSVLLRFTDSDPFFSIFTPFYFLYFDFRLLITVLYLPYCVVSVNICKTYII